MHEAALAQAALPAPVVVLGMSLKPYSIGHELWLIREGNPLQGTATAPTAQDLAQAVLICCQGWNENAAMNTDLLLGLKLWIWKQRVKGFDFKAELQAFLDYQKAGSLEFPLSSIQRPDAHPSRASGAPFLLRLQQWLMTTFGMSETQAWDYPLGLAKMRWETHWENEGGLEIYNEHEAEFDRFVREQENATCQA